MVYFLFKFGFEYYYAYMFFVLNSILTGFLNLWIAKNLICDFSVPKFLKVVLGNIIITTSVIVLVFKTLDGWLIVNDFLGFLMVTILEILIVLFLIYSLGVDKKHKVLIKQHIKSRIKYSCGSN